ncbi:MAG: thiamine pyrophosphate-binding protein [Chloroflexi bacterium]|nr:thiamine pyrophosphate-binding protein [Chloroflexota bacterium]
MIPSLEALRAIHDLRRNALVVATMTGRREWDTLSQNPAQDMAINAMGKASSFALGLALAQPTRKVIVIDGDGSLLMNLGTLASVAGKKPANLVHIVLENGGYTNTGGEPTPGAGISSLPEMAKGAGYAKVYEYDDIEEFRIDVEGVFREKGPVFICLHVRHADMPRTQMRSSAQTAHEMQEMLAHSPS